MIGQFEVKFAAIFENQKVRILPHIAFEVKAAPSIYHTS